MSDDAVPDNVTATALDETLSGTSSSDITVIYAITGTASGDDYTLADGTLTIAAGDSSGTITIGSIIDDALDEVDETVIITLSNPNGASLGSKTVHTYTITDNDAAPGLSIADVTAGEGDGTVTLTVSLDAVSGQDVTFSYASSDGTAEAGSDYTP